MSTPQRQPKFDKKTKKYDQLLTILTLKDGLKLVVSCDSYNGIIMEGEVCRCVLCDVEVERTEIEMHKETCEHKRSRLRIPHLEELSENLVRQLNSSTCYCTICNVTTPTVTVARHIQTTQHLTELSMAINRADAYATHYKNNKL